MTPIGRLALSINSGRAGSNVSTLLAVIEAPSRAGLPDSRVSSDNSASRNAVPLLLTEFGAFTANLLGNVTDRGWACRIDLPPATLLELLNNGYCDSPKALREVITVLLAYGDESDVDALIPIIIWFYPVSDIARALELVNELEHHPSDSEFFDRMMRENVMQVTLGHDDIDAIASPRNIRTLEEALRQSAFDCSVAIR